MTNLIEYRYSDDLIVQFTPKENGKAEYSVTIHDFDNLDGWNGTMTHGELMEVLENPNNAMRIARQMY